MEAALDYNWIQQQQQRPQLNKYNPITFELVIYFFGIRTLSIIIGIASLREKLITHR